MKALREVTVCFNNSTGVVFIPRKNEDYTDRPHIEQVEMVTKELFNEQLEQANMFMRELHEAIEVIENYDGLTSSDVVQALNKLKRTKYLGNSKSKGCGE